MATIGQVGNVDHENVSLGKAGRTRWLGKMPHNRGVSMNPVDHPHGGGEGKTSGGRHPVTPWGQPTRGYKTRNNKRTDKLIVTQQEQEEVRHMGRSVKKGTVYRHATWKQDRGAHCRERKESGAHLVAPLDDSSGVRRPHHRGSQRQEVHSGVHHRKHGGAQAGRVFADPHFQGPLGEGGDGEVGQAQRKAEADNVGKRSCKPKRKRDISGSRRRRRGWWWI